MLLLLTLLQSGGVLAAGTEAETPWFVRDSGVEGPAILIVGGIHGNEPAGAAAAEQIKDWRVIRGKLLVIPRANVRSLDASKRLIPGAEDGLRDLNRNFPEGREPLSKALWEFVRKHRPDWLLDLHEGYGFSRTSKSVGSSVITVRTDEARKAAMRMVEAVDRTIKADDRRFTIRGPPVEGSLARAAHRELGIPSLIVETTFKDQSLSYRTRQHRILVHRFLADLQMIDHGPHVLLPAGREPGRIRVGVYDSTGSTSSPGPAAFDTLLRGFPEMVVRRVNRWDVKAGVLPQFDVVVFPGGSGSRQANGLGDDGRKEVRAFVEAGGGYYGSCAGAYLSTRRYAWSLGLLDARTIDSKHWNRGVGDVSVEMTERGREILGDLDRFDVRYANGPILGPADDPELPDFETLAVFRSEVAKNGAPKGVMIGTPALAAGTFGRGRVFCSSPHPEYSENLGDLVRRGIRWAADR